MLRFLVGLAFLLLGVSDLSAQIEVGAIAPEIPKTKWLNSKKPLALDDLRDRVVVLTFWNAVDTASLLDGTPFVDWWKPVREQGAVFIVISEDSAEVIAPILEAKRIPIPIATSSKANQLYLPGEESMTFVVAWDGRIVWRGSPRSKDLRKVIEGQTKLAHDLGKIFDPRPMRDKHWDKFVDACLDGNLSKAEKALDKIVDGKDQDLAMHALGMFIVLLMHVEDRVEYSMKIAAQGRAHEAILLLEASAKMYKGYATADELKDDVKVIKQIHKDYLSVDKKRVKALEKAFRGDRDGALKALEALLLKAKNSKIKLLLEREINHLKTMGVIVKEK